MYSELSSNCFNVAISIARQREQSSLLSTLLDFITKHLPEHQCVLYDVAGKDPLELRQHEHANNIAIKDDSLLAQCYHSQNNISAALTNAQYSYAFPVHGIGYIKHIIALQGHELDEDEYRTLLQLLTLFNNQYLLLDNNNHDALTGLLNRRAFEERLSQLIQSHKNSGRENPNSYCFAIFDIDHFKRVNDTFGHLYGDEVLILFAGIMENVFRHEDMLFRYGGEEFAVVLSNVDLEMADSILNRFRDKVAAYDFPQVGQVTVSIGFTAITNLSNTTDMIAHADKALYYSKESGRNQVHAYETLLQQGKIIDKIRDSEKIEIF